MKNKASAAAFTLVELLLVIGIFAIILGFSALYSQFSQVRADLNTQVATFTSYARLQQSSAASGKANQSFSMHLEEDVYTLFEGATYNAADPGNAVIDLPPTVKIQNIDLTGEGNDVIFVPPYGETETYGTLNFYSTTLNKTITITISQIGTINY